MTASELHKAFKMTIDKEDIITVPSFTPTEIDHWLNTAQDRLISSKFTGNNQSRSGIEQSQKRNDDFRLLIKHTNYNPDDFNMGTYVNYKYYEFPFPPDYMFGVGDSATVDAGDSAILVDTIESRIEYLDRQLNNRLSEVNLHNGITRPVKVYHDNKILLYMPFGPTILEYRLYYIKYPERILHSSIAELVDVPEYMWSEIISLAARLALANTSDSRYSAYAQESQLAE